MTEPTPPTDAKAVDAALALLSLITGDDWDRAKLIEKSSHLRDVAVHTLKRQGLTDDDASSFVDSRWEQYAADIPQDTDPSPSTQETAVLSVATNLEANNEPLDINARLADYLARKEDPVPTEGTGSPGEPAS